MEPPASYPEPTEPISDRREYYVSLLDYVRESAISRVGALVGADQSSSALALGWTPLSLLKHLAFVEMRWLEWGFEGTAVDDPWADRIDGRFVALPTETFASLSTALTSRGTTTRRILRAHDLHDVGHPSERWDGAPPPTLERIVQHLAYEYARHLGHLDIVVEVAAGVTGG